ncbi:hypothetical protein BC829DRAFT_395808, partial [Chytridium lagenaria]
DTATASNHPLTLIILITSIHVIHAVTLLPPKVRPNGLITLSVRVLRIIENEQDTQKGWSTRFVQDADGKIRSITWSGGTVQPQFIQDFQSVIGTRIYFPVFQSCTSNVQVQWIDRITTNIPPISPTFPQHTSPPAATTTNMDLPPNIIRNRRRFLRFGDDEDAGGIERTGSLPADGVTATTTTTVRWRWRRVKEWGFGLLSRVGVWFIVVLFVRLVELW